MEGKREYWPMGQAMQDTPAKAKLLCHVVSLLKRLKFMHVTTVDSSSEQKHQILCSVTVVLGPNPQNTTSSPHTTPSPKQNSMADTGTPPEQFALHHGFAVFTTIPKREACHTFVTQVSSHFNENNKKKTERTNKNTLGSTTGVAF